VFEMLLPDDATPRRAKPSDVLMLLLFGGARERTAGESRRLLERVGGQSRPMSVIEASRVRPPG